MLWGWRGKNGARNKKWLKKYPWQISTSAITFKFDLDVDLSCSARVPHWYRFPRSIFFGAKEQHAFQGRPPLQRRKRRMLKQHSYSVSSVCCFFQSVEIAIKQPVPVSSVCRTTLLLVSKQKKKVLLILLWASTIWLFWNTSILFNSAESLSLLPSRVEKPLRRILHGQLWGTSWILGAVHTLASDYQYGKHSKNKAWYHEFAELLATEAATLHC